MSSPPPSKPRRRRRRMRRTWPQRLRHQRHAACASVCVGAASASGTPTTASRTSSGSVITHADVTSVTGRVRPTTTAPAARRPTTRPATPRTSCWWGPTARARRASAADSPYAGGLRRRHGELVRHDHPGARSIPNGGQAAILSFPRDLWVTIAGTGRKAQDQLGLRTGQPEPPRARRSRRTSASSSTTRCEVELVRVQDARRRHRRGEGAVRLPDQGREHRPRHRRTPGCVTFSGDEALAYVRSRHYQYDDGQGLAGPTARPTTGASPASRTSSSGRCRRRSTRAPATRRRPRA